VKTFTAEIKHGDCLDVLADYPDNTFDLIVTSPPYADKRRKTYGGVRSGCVKTISYKKALSLVKASTHNCKPLQSSFANANQLEALLLKASPARPMTAKRKTRIFGDLKRS
jgi:DNA modification methylase